MAKAKNILFIMFDQLRWDHLSCYGHPHLHTPNIDRLAEKGVRFTNARIQSPLCGPSRMSILTGRYVNSHGASWNGTPLRVGEKTMGDHLRDVGMDAWLVGKTHMNPDVEGMNRLGIDPNSKIGRRVSECGLDVFERDDGLNFEGAGIGMATHSAEQYNKYLNAKGYEGENPWHDYANSAVDDDGNVLSGWFLKYSDRQANIAEEDSETPYMTRRGIEFMESRDGATPWMCHLSLIKPHWPYIVPAPYHDMYGPETHLPPIRSDAELQTDHPIFRANINTPVSKAFSQNHARTAALTGYMGLIKQIDDQMGVLFEYLEQSGRMDDTLIVLTSDHGDYLGDHWMGEKMFFHDTSVKIPLIIYDPSPEADATRGTVSDALVEQLDFAATFYEVAGGDLGDADNYLEGQSLLPILHGKKTETTRAASFCEYDYSHTPTAEQLNVDPKDARIFMVATKKWKMLHFEGGFRPMLFDLENDPNELNDLGTSGNHDGIIEEMYAHLHHWSLRCSQRVTVTNKNIRTRRKNMFKGGGIFIGVWDENSVPEERAAIYTGRKAQDRRSKSG